MFFDEATISKLLVTIKVINCQSLCFIFIIMTLRMLSVTIMTRKKVSSNLSVRIFLMHVARKVCQTKPSATFQVLAHGAEGNGL